MDVSIVFVNYKTKELTINAIKSVFEKTVGLEFEIFVVDNNSQDGSIEAVEKEFPNINIIKNQINAGFGAANNLAIKKAKGKYILCLNTDTLLINNAIKIMFDFMEKEENQNTGACGGTLYNNENQPCNCGAHFQSPKEVFWKFGLKYIFKDFYYKNISYTGRIEDIKSRIVDVEQIIGADLFLRKSALDEVGLFDENFFMYLEETDLCRRIKNKGYEIKLLKEAKITHLEGQSNKDILKARKIYKKSEFYYYKKYYNKPLIFIIKVLYLMLYLIDWLFLRNMQSKELFSYILKEWRI